MVDSNKATKVMALDISTTCTGVAKAVVLDNGTISDLTVSSIKPKSTLNIYERKDFIDRQLQSDLLWADLVIIEGYAFGGTSVVQLAEFNGVIKLTIHRLSKPMELIAPTTVKKQITGNGRAKKPDVRKALTTLKECQHLSFANTDESDAVALLLAWVRKRKEVKGE